LHGSLIFCGLWALAWVTLGFFGPTCTPTSRKPLSLVTGTGFFVDHGFLTDFDENTISRNFAMVNYTP